MKKIILPVLVAVLSAVPSTLFSQDNEKLIKDYISQNKLREYKKLDLSNFIVDNVDSSHSMNGTVVKFQQTYNGLLIYNAVGTVLVKDNKIVYYTDNFIKNYDASTPNTTVVSKEVAVITSLKIWKVQKSLTFLYRGFLIKVIKGINQLIRDSSIRMMIKEICV